MKKSNIICKCGALYDKVKTIPGVKTTWECPECQNTFSRKSKNYREPEEPQSTKFTAIEVGAAIVDYIMWLDFELRRAQDSSEELAECQRERDALQQQINEMQAKYNEHKIKEIDIPRSFL